MYKRGVAPADIRPFDALCAVTETSLVAVASNQISLCGCRGNQLYTVTTRDVTHTQLAVRALSLRLGVHDQWR